MNETIETRKIETKTCTRCGGEGKLWHFSNVHNGVCFKCNGAKELLTKRGAAANKYLIALRCKRADALQVGDLVRESVGWNPAVQTTAFFTVVSVAPLTFENACGWSLVDGKPFLPAGHLKIELSHPRHGTSSRQAAPDELLRVGCTAEFKAATLVQALDFQDTLTKTGTVKKN